MRVLTERGRFASRSAGAKATSPIERERVTMIGLACAFLEASRKKDLDLTCTHRFEAARPVFAGGSVLSGHAFASRQLFSGMPVASCSGGISALNETYQAGTSAVTTTLATT